MGPAVLWEAPSCKPGCKGLLPKLATQLMAGPIQLLIPSVALQHLCLLALIQEHFLEHQQLDLLGIVISFTDFANYCSSAFSFDGHNFLAILIEHLIQIYKSLNLILLLLARWRRLQNQFQLWLSQMMVRQVELGQKELKKYPLDVQDWAVGMLARDIRLKRYTLINVATCLRLLFSPCNLCPT